MRGCSRIDDPRNIIQITRIRSKITAINEAYTRYFGSFWCCEISFGKILRLVYKRKILMLNQTHELLILFPSETELVPILLLLRRICGQTSLICKRVCSLSLVQFVSRRISMKFVTFFNNMACHVIMSAHRCLSIIHFKTIFQNASLNTTKGLSLF